MSASPVKADDFIELSSSGDACDRFKQLLRNNTLLNQVFDWLLDSDGNISEEAAASAEQYTGPIGMIVAWGGSSMPSDSWRVCNGQAISRTDFSILYQRYGITWGAGDGSTTFNIPDLQDRLPIGAGATAALSVESGSATATLTSDNLPSHTHSMVINKINVDNEQTGTDGVVLATEGANSTAKTTESTGSGNAFSIIPPVTGVYFIIKVK
jgi:microcystin-dependent protein